MHIIVCLAKLMEQQRTLPTSQVLTRMKLYILILTDNLRNTSFFTTACSSRNLTKNNSPKEICSHSSLSTPSLPQSIRIMRLRPPQPPSFFSSSESVTPYRSRSFFFTWLLSQASSSFSTSGSSMQLHAFSSFAPPSFLHNLSHTPNTDLPMHIHVAVMERYPPPKIRVTNYTQSKSQGPSVFTLCGDLFSCYNTCSKSTMKKLDFLHGSIITNDEFVLLTIESKWFETIMHMTKYEFLGLPCRKQF